MPIELRGRLPASQTTPTHSDSVLARQAIYYGPIPRERIPDPAWIASAARDFEAAGLDSALVAQRSSWADVWAVSTWALSATERLKIVCAHRVGFQMPTLAARALATLDRLSNGRAMIHVIQGNSEEDQQRDGDFLDKPSRYARAGEYMEIFKREMTADEPFDYEGHYFRTKGSWSSFKPVQRPFPTISAAGASKEGLEFCTTHADVYAITSEPLDTTAELLTRVRALAAFKGRTLRFWRDCNFIIAPTDDAAWQKAEAITEELGRAGDRAKVWEQKLKVAGDKIVPHSEGHQRVLAASERGPRVDRALFTGTSKMAAGTVASAFVGSPETAAAAVLDYYDLGIEIFSIGLAVVTDEDRALRSELLQRLREGAAERDRRRPPLSA